MTEAVEARSWQVVYVEDDATMLRQVKEYLDSEAFDFGPVKVTGVSNFDDALVLLKERKVDVVILDIYRGDTTRADRAGLGVLQMWRKTGFAPVIVHTALAEEVSGQGGIFVRVVPKEADSLKRLSAEMKDLFATNIPQIHRAIIEHVDASLRLYMWGFVVDRWSDMKRLATGGDFVRLLLRRLGVELTRGVAPLIGQLYPGTGVVDPEPDKVHPVEYYIKPPVSDDPQLGDLRRLVRGNVEVLHAIVWPSCDLVMRDGAQKVEKALAARVRPLAEFSEYKKWVTQASPSKSATNALLDLMKNNRQGQQPERYYFLPAAWDMPASVVDLADLEHVALAELNAAPCDATIASPFAESMAAQFVRYLARLGTPDLDLKIALASLPRPSVTGTLGSSSITPAPPVVQTTPKKGGGQALGLPSAPVSASIDIPPSTSSTAVPSTLVPEMPGHAKAMSATDDTGDDD